MSDEPSLRHALQELAEVPGPANLSGRALRTAKTVRRGRFTAGVAAALAAVGVLALPFVIKATSQPPGLGIAAEPTKPNTVNNPDTDCVAVPQAVPAVKEVAQQNWPAFVSAAIAKLPARSDYVMQSGYVCATTRDSYAVINLGPMREHGHLTINLIANNSQLGRANSGKDSSVSAIPVDCSKLTAAIASAPVPEPPADPSELLFCEDATATAPMVYGVSSAGVVTVTAAYSDHRTIWMETHGASYNSTPEVTAEALRVVVTDAALANLLKP